jgi:hypothetical protein
MPVAAALQKLHHITEQHNLTVGTLVNRKEIPLAIFPLTGINGTGRTHFDDISERI